MWFQLGLLWQEVPLKRWLLLIRKVLPLLRISIGISPSSILLIIWISYSKVYHGVCRTNVYDEWRLSDLHIYRGRCTMFIWASKSGLSQTRCFSLTPTHFETVDLVPHTLLHIQFCFISHLFLPVFTLSGIFPFLIGQVLGGPGRDVGGHDLGSPNGHYLK